jgi:hypothetical protein
MGAVMEWLQLVLLIAILVLQVRAARQRPVAVPEAPAAVDPARVAAREAVVREFLHTSKGRELLRARIAAKVGQ